MERAEVAVVDPDHVGIGKDMSYLVGGVYLEQRLEAERVCRIGQMSALLGCEHRGYEKYGIGSGGTRLVYLVFVYDELLAQQRQRRDGTCGGEIGDTAAEELAVGEYRHGGRAAALVCRGHIRWMCIARDPSLGW